jgi:hypothetical protein
MASSWASGKKGPIQHSSCKLRTKLKFVAEPLTTASSLADGKPWIFSCKLRKKLSGAEVYTRFDRFWPAWRSKTKIHSLLRHY